MGAPRGVPGAPCLPRLPQRERLTRPPPPPFPPPPAAAQAILLPLLPPYKDVKLMVTGGSAQDFATTDTPASDGAFVINLSKGPAAK